MFLLDAEGCHGSGKKEQDDHGGPMEKSAVDHLLVCPWRDVVVARPHLWSPNSVKAREGDDEGVFARPYLTPGSVTVGICAECPPEGFPAS
jgi:hypothetical protein